MSQWKSFTCSLKRVTLMSVVIVASAGAMPPKFELEKDPEVLRREAMAKISRAIEENMPQCDKAKGKDVTIFLGNTGAGKSTLLNVLAGVSLEVNDDAELVLKDPSKGAKVAGGGSSITKFPEYIYSQDLGDMYDLPGFDDTDGMVADILNASFIRSILTNAKSVRVLALVGIPEIEAKRGDAFKGLAKKLEMFSDAGFRDNSVMLVVNRVDREKIEHQKADKIFEKIGPTPGLLVSGLIDKKRYFFLPRARVGDGEDFLTKFRLDFVGKIKTIKGLKVSAGELDMSVTLNSSASHDLESYFRVYMDDQLADTQKNYLERIKKIESDVSAKRLEGPASKLFAAQNQNLWEEFTKTLNETKTIVLLTPLVAAQYQRSLDAFRAPFDQSYRNLVSTLEIKEQTEAKLAAERQKKAAEEEAKQAQEAAKKAEKAKDDKEAERQEAEKKAQLAAEEARRAQADKTLSEAQKKEAEEKAKQALEEKKRVEQESQEALKRFEELASESKKARIEAEEAARKSHEENEQMQKLHAEKLKTMSEEIERREERARLESEAMRQQLQQISEKNASEREQLQQKIQETEEKFTRALKEAEVRERSLKDSIEQAKKQQQDPQRGRLVVLWTPHGPVLGVI